MSGNPPRVAEALAEALRIAEIDGDHALVADLAALLRRTKPQPVTVAVAGTTRAYVPRTLEELVDLRPWVLYDPDEHRLWCQHCRARTIIPRGVDMEVPYRSFSLSHSLCVPRGAGRPPERSTVSRVVPPPRTAATPAPRTQRASWHGGPGEAEAGRAKPAKAARVDVRDESYTSDPDEGGGW